MSNQVSALAGSIHAAPPSVKRPTGNFHPALWGDHFLSCISHSEAKNASVDQDEYDGLKQEVRRMLSDDVKSETYQKLRFIDAAKRLGVAYHFKSEIEDALTKIYHNYNNDEFDDLFTTSLRFRLLRQQGFKISCDAFEKFKDGEGKFKSSLCHDVLGMLSLYEAAYLGIRGEDILDEAIAFTTTNLKSKLAQANPQEAEEISHALDRPIQKCLERLEARHYMIMYARDESHDVNLLKFAKLDFNILQVIHQKELKGIMEWWKSLEVATKLPYCRDRIVECYCWIMEVYFESQYSLARKIVTKIMAVSSILDDTYDNYGIWEELELLTEAIQKWDIRANIDQLSETMKLVCRILFDVYNETEEDLAKEGKLYRVHYGKEAMKRAAQHFLAEAKWRSEGYIPTFEEYMDVAQVTTCYPMLTISSFLGMGPIATIEAFEWASEDPKIVKASSVICRLMDDIVSHEFEQQRPHVASSIECYINQHGISENEVIKLFRKEIANAWKDVNEECLQPTIVPMPLLERVLNFSRAMDVLYKEGDGYTNAHIIKDHIALLLKDPVTI